MKQKADQFLELPSFDPIPETVAGIDVWINIFNGDDRAAIYGDHGDMNRQLAIRVQSIVRGVVDSLGKPMFTADQAKQLLGKRNMIGEMLVDLVSHHNDLEKTKENGVLDRLKADSGNPKMAPKPSS